MSHPQTVTLPIEPAATIVLVREHKGELQTYLLRRSPALRFMPGLHVFPGGRVDPTDRDITVWGEHADLEPAGACARLGKDLTVSEALGFAVAAIRETYEEAGVLLVHGPSGEVGAMASLHSLRTSGGLESGWLADHAQGNRWTMALSRLSRWSRWVTPSGMKRRYDTLFLVAPAPQGQTCRPDGRESDRGLWISPARALEENLVGETPLSPPTIVTLHELLAFPDLGSLQGALPSRLGLDTMAPRLVQLERGGVIVEPWDPEFAQEQLKIDGTDLEQRVLQAGKPFSRIWFNGTAWRPISV